MEFDDLFVVERLGNSRSLCLSNLAIQTITESDAADLGGECGLFIYEVDDSQPMGGGVQVLAKAASLDAAFRLIDLWRTRSTR